MGTFLLRVAWVSYPPTYLQKTNILGSSEFYVKFSAFCFVLLLIIISEAIILLRAKINDETTPPAPNIKIFFFFDINI